MTLPNNSKNNIHIASIKNYKKYNFCAKNSCKIVNFAT